MYGCVISRAFLVGVEATMVLEQRLRKIRFGPLASVFLNLEQSLRPAATRLHLVLHLDSSI